MGQIPELNNKLTVSIGLIAAIVSLTFMLTREYMLVHALQERVEYINDRATRLDNDQQITINDLEKRLKELEK